MKLRNKGKDMLKERKLYYMQIILRQLDHLINIEGADIVTQRVKPISC